MAESQMKRYIVVSTNNNSDYYFYLPYIEKAWNSYGWDLVVMITDDVDVTTLKTNNPNTLICRLPNIDGVRKESIAQAGRLYAANYIIGNDLIMTSDMDLLPLSNYWNPNVFDVTVYGHDLTDFSYFPMGYTAMRAEDWRHFMKLTNDTKADLERDCNEYSYMVKSNEWEQWWNFDWRMLTDRLTHAKIVHKHRGRQANGFAYGRIDRGNSMQMIDGELIDAHCENHNVQHPDKLNKFITLFESVHGKL
jgi:hypothetical protein